MAAGGCRDLELKTLTLEIKKVQQFCVPHIIKHESKLARVLIKCGYVGQTGQMLSLCACL